MAAIKIISESLQEGFNDYGIRDRLNEAIDDNLAIKLKDELSLQEFLEERHYKKLLYCFLRAYLPTSDYNEYVRTAYLHNDRSKDRTDQQRLEQDKRNRITAATKIKIDRIAFKAYGYRRATGNRKFSYSVEEEIDVSPAHIQEVPPVYIQEMAENHENEEDNTENIENIEMIPAENHGDENTMIENGEDNMENIENIDLLMQMKYKYKNGNENNDDNEKQIENENLIKFKEAFNQEDICCICHEDKGPNTTMGKLPCTCKKVMHIICLLELLRRKLKCPNCRVASTHYYIDNNGDYIEPEVRMEDEDCFEVADIHLPMTYEEIRARNAVREEIELQEQEDEQLNSATLFDNEQAQQNRDEHKVQRDRERTERREQLDIRRNQFISLNNRGNSSRIIDNQQNSSPKRLAMDMEVKEAGASAHNDDVRENDREQQSKERYVHYKQCSSSNSQNKSSNNMINWSSSISENQEHSSLKSSHSSVMAMQMKKQNDNSGIGGCEQGGFASVDIKEMALTQEDGIDMNCVEMEGSDKQLKTINQPYNGHATDPEMFDKKTERELDNLNDLVAKTLKLDDHANDYDASMDRQVYFIKKLSNDLKETIDADAVDAHERKWSNICYIEEEPTGDEIRQEFGKRERQN